MVGGTSQDLALRGGRVHLREWGEGEPVLLLHGVLTHSFIFEPIVPMLAARYRVLVPDLLGCGASEKVEAELSISAHAARTLALMDALKLEKVHLVGHDVGGGIAQLMALNAEARFSSLSLINPVGYDYWPVPAIETLRLPIIRQLVMASFDLGTLKALIRHGLAHPERLDAALFARFAEPFSTQAGRQSFLAFLRALSASELMKRASELTTLTLPTLVLHGAKDHYLSTEITRRLAEDIPEARLEQLEDVGHFAMLDAPEAVAEALLTLLDQASTAP
ncbi:MAG: alpha/beta hydrolase [Deltaproteobacteria bacterium]|nr:alpha/beta hydrolase [Deltaproteobacteria bacterium]